MMSLNLLCIVSWKLQHSFACICFGYLWCSSATHVLSYLLCSSALEWSHWWGRKQWYL